MSDSEITETVLSMGKRQLTATSHLYSEFGPIGILQAAKQNAVNYTLLSRSRPAVRLIEVILAANRNYNKVVKPHIERICNESDLKTFDQLIHLINSKLIEEFYSFWGHKNQRKYQVLTGILDRVPLLRQKYPTAIDDFDLMNKWANDVDLPNYKHDIIGQIKFVAIATIQHLRMCFGCNTVKPDQRVKEVLQREFGYQSLSNLAVVQTVENISRITGLPTLVVDQVFVNYGSGYFNIGARRDQAS